MNAGPGVRIWLGFEPVDRRQGFDGLAARVQYVLEQDPYGGHWFVFRSRNGTRLRILTFDGVGWWLHYRRLEAGTFTWPAIHGRGAIELSAAQFAVLTQGLDWRRVQVPQVRVPICSKAALLPPHRSARRDASRCRRTCRASTSHWSPRRPCAGAERR